MVEHLNAVASKRGMFLCVLAASLTIFPVCSSSAQDLVDPMRPPVGLGQVQIDATPAGPVLQSVLISPTRRIAIISGKTLKTGDKFGDAQVLAINETEVILKNGKNRQVLRLYPSLHEPPPAKPSELNREHPGQSK